MCRIVDLIKHLTGDAKVVGSVPGTALKVLKQGILFTMLLPLTKVHEKFESHCG